MALSGRWRGYWEAVGWGRRPMRLTLSLGGGRIDGEGSDCIGAFTFSGQYDSAGRVVMIKQYLGRHQVLYEGTYDGEGTIFGAWSIGAFWSGAFALSLETTDEPADAVEAVQILPVTSSLARAW